MERLESAKAGLMAALGGSIALAPILLASDGLQANPVGALLSCIGSCALFGVTF
eukprot:evm.model.scf_1227.3 EVM.evm.TU.scf_1227.3   scf_1227:41398-41558(-)